MSALNKVEYPRCLTPPGANGIHILFVFCDACRLAFGACAYVRWKSVDWRQIVAARSRVPPLKELTIPRLGLQTAVMASRLGKATITESRLLFEAIISAFLIALLCSPGSKINPELQTICVQPNQRNSKHIT